MAKQLCLMEVVEIYIQASKSEIKEGPPYS
jgi:hypothetical protein